MSFSSLWAKSTISQVWDARASYRAPDVGNPLDRYGFGRSTSTLRDQIVADPNVGFLTDRPFQAKATPGATFVPDGAVPTESQANLTYGMRRMLVAPESEDSAALRLPVVEPQQFAIGRKHPIGRHKSRMGKLKLPIEYRRRGEGSLEDTDRWGWMEPASFNANQALRTARQYAAALKANPGMNVAAFWHELLARPEEKPNAYWASEYFIDGVVYDREASDQAGGRFGNITLSSTGTGQGIAPGERMARATNVFRTFTESYGMMKCMDYTLRQGSCEGAMFAWVFKRFEVSASDVYRILTTDYSAAAVVGNVSSTFAATAAGVDKDTKLYVLQLAPLAWQPGTFIPMDYLKYSVHGHTYYDGISINCGHIFARGQAAIARSGGSDVGPSLAPSELLPWKDNSLLYSLKMPPMKLFLSLDYAHN